MKGHITVYFSLLLLILFSLLCTMIESARLGGVRIRCQSGAYLALESVFADYYLPVAKEYGLLMLDKSYGTDNPDEYQSYLLDYMSCNMTANKDLFVPGADFCQATAESVSLQSEKVVAGGGGVALEDEILAYMEYAAPAEIIEWVTGRMGVLDEAETVGGMLDELSQIQPEASKVDLSVQGIHRGMEQVRECNIDVDGMAERVYLTADELEDLYLDYEYAGSSAEKARILVEIDLLERSAALQVQELVQGYGELLDYNRYIAEQKKNYERNTQLVGDKLADIEGKFEEEREQLSGDMRRTLEEELANIHMFSAGEGDYYEIGRATQAVPRNIEILEQNIQELSPYMSGGMEGLKSAAMSCISKMAAYQTDGMALNYRDEKVSGKGVNVMESVKKLLGNGLLGLVVDNPDALSENFFSGRSMYEDSLKGYDYEKEELYNQILINEYLLSRFGNFGEPTDGKVLSYELEYILGGKEADRENLTKVATELLLLRTPLNLIYLLGSAEKRAEAEGLALLLVGFTGMYGAVKLTELLILAVWAQAEAIADVRTLFSGGKVPLLKDDRTWKLGMEGLVKLGTSSFPTGSADTGGLDYKDYLRLLLMKEKRSVRNGRTLDLIEGVVRKNYDAGFSLGNCVTELVVRTGFRAEPMFLTFPFIRRMGMGEDYYIEGFSSYAY